MVFKNLLSVRNTGYLWCFKYFICLLGCVMSKLITLVHCCSLLIDELIGEESCLCCSLAVLEVVDSCHLLKGSQQPEYMPMYHSFSCNTYVFILVIMFVETHCLIVLCQNTLHGSEQKVCWMTMVWPILKKMYQTFHHVMFLANVPHNCNDTW
jgi:hypothetical protein